MPRLFLEEVRQNLEVFENPQDEFEETYGRTLVALQAFNSHRGGLIAALTAIATAQDAYLRSKPQENSPSRATPEVDLDDYGWTDVSLADGDAL